MGDGCFFGLVPVGDGQTYGFAGMRSEEFDDPMSGRLSRFRRRFAGFGGPVPEYLDGLRRDEQVHCGPVERLELGRWHTGRVVLIGDAAHAAPPHMGEGGSMALEDAVVLAEILGNADTLETALEAFERRRRPRGRVGPAAEPNRRRSLGSATGETRRRPARTRRRDAAGAVPLPHRRALTPPGGRVPRRDRGEPAPLPGIGEPLGGHEPGMLLIGSRQACRRSR